MTDDRIKEIAEKWSKRWRFAPIMTTNEIIESAIREALSEVEKQMPTDEEINKEASRPEWGTTLRRGFVIGAVWLRSRLSGIAPLFQEEKE